MIRYSVMVIVMSFAVVDPSIPSIKPMSVVDKSCTVTIVRDVTVNQITAADKNKLNKLNYILMN